MHVAVRPYFAAGVALAAAGVIAVSPVSPPTPAIHVPALNASSVAVDLTAQANPIEAWLKVFGDVGTNVTTIGGQMADQPAPILRQVIANQIGYAQTLATGIGGVPGVFNTWATVTLPAAFQLASDRIAEDNIVDAANAINNALGSALFIFAGMFPAAAIPGQITDNLTNAVHALTGLGTLMNLFVAGLVNPIQATVSAAGDSGQAFVNAMNAGDQVEALTALVNAPAAMAGGFLNGVSSTRVPGHPEIPGHGAFFGIFTAKDNPAQGGLVQQLLVGLPRTIAAAITPPAPTTVTLDTGSTSSAVEAAEPEAEQPAAELKAESAPTIKLGNKTVPRKAASGARDARTKAVKTLRNNVKSALGKTEAKDASSDE